MNDRELLEYAAKAANLEYLWREDEFGAGFVIELGAGFGRYWNPLEDDGDALRLAVKLGIDAGTFRMVINSYQVTAYVSGNEGVDLLNDNDPCAATRRAIVRAAAEIGKTK